MDVQNVLSVSERHMKAGKQHCSRYMLQIVGLPQITA